MRAVVLVLVALTGANLAVAAPPPMRPPIADRIAEPIAPSSPPPDPTVPDPPHPAPEIAQVGAQLAGTWTCKGFALAGDGSSRPVKETRTIALALDNAWIKITVAQATAGHAATLVEERTYDAVGEGMDRDHVCRYERVLDRDVARRRPRDVDVDVGRVRAAGTQQLEDLDRARRQEAARAHLLEVGRL